MKQLRIFLLLMAGSLCLALSVNAQDVTVIYESDFENELTNGIPTGWVTYNEAGFHLHEFNEDGSQFTYNYGGNPGGGGSRIYEGFSGDFTKALYWGSRNTTEGYAEFGSQVKDYIMEDGSISPNMPEGIALKLVPGEYHISFQMAAWKGEPTFYVTLFDLDYIVYATSKGFVATPNMEGVVGEVTGTTTYNMNFSVDKSGYYILRFTSAEETWLEYLLASVKVWKDESPLLIVNDTNHPWTVEGNTAIIRGDGSNKRSSSWLTMSYSSEEPTEFSFDWAMYNWSDHTNFQVYIDGVYKDYTSNSSYNHKRYYLDAGEHVIAFRDSMYNSSNNWSGIKNIKVKEVLPLETAVLTENSMPLTFTNNSATPWMIEDGYVEHGNYGERNVGGSFSTTFKVEKTSKFSFKRKVTALNNDNAWWNSSDYHQLIVKINGIEISTDGKLSDFTNWDVVLEPDNYTVEWKDTVFYDYANNWFYSQVKDVELSNSWMTCELASSGTLGVEALYQVNVLNDIEMLKVIGPMNSSDWTDIKNMKNLRALDLSEAILTEIPDNAFDGKGWLNSVILPEGIRRIGSYAFQGTNIRRINIPSTVTTIGRNAFISTPLQYLTFANGSQLTSIEKYAFKSCSSLQEVVLPEKVTSIGYGAFDLCSSVKKVEMPNTVTFLGAYAFASCRNMKSIHFSDALTEIPEWACLYANSLEDVHLPVGLTRINYEAFRDNTSLRHIDIPSTVNIIVRNAFYNCALDSIKLPTRLQYLGTEAFSYCNNLKYIEFPSYIERRSYSYCYSYGNDGDYKYWDNNNSGYRSNFTYCPSLETIVMRSAAPPVNDADAFANSRAKSKITLKVPSFAVVNYKLDSYWYQFGSIVEGDDVDYWRIANALSLTNNRRMNGKPDIDLYDGGQLTVGGNAPMEIGQFNIFPYWPNPGRLLNTCENITADNINTIWGVDGETWYFFTPLHDVDLTKVSVSDDASYVFRYYDGSSRATNGTGNSWRNVDDGKLVAGKGYIFRCNKTAVVTMPADAAGHAQVFNTKDVTTTLSAYEAAAAANKSWNYVGNPYPCYYDIYYMDFTAPITVWTGSTYKAYSIVDDEFALRPMQSFFVQKPDAVDNIIFHKEGRQLVSDINHAAVGAKTREVAQKEKRYFFELQMMNDEQADETRVVLNSQASLDYELEHDAAKFMSFESSVPQIYTLDAKDNGYAINERPLDNGLVPLAFYAGKAGHYTITATRADGDIYLQDQLLNKIVNLTEQDYVFYSDKTEGVNTSRFTLSLIVPHDLTGIDAIASDPTAIDAPIYDLQGRKVLPSSIKKGVYIQNGKKIFIR